MQDQGKRLMLAVALALGVLFLWNTLTQEEQPPPDKAKAAETAPKPAPPQVGVAAGAGETAGPGAASAGSPTAGAATAGTPAAPVEETPRPAEEIITLPFDNVVATFSSYCGGLKSWRLTDKRYEHDATRGHLLPEKSLMTVLDATGKSIPVPDDQLARLPDCGAFEVNFASSTFVIPPRAVWKGEQVSKTEVAYTRSSEQLDVVKTFTITPELFLVRMSVKVAVRAPAGTEARQQLAVSVYSFQDPSKVEESSQWVQSAPRAWASSTMRGGTIVTTGVAAAIEWPRYEPELQWTGFEHPYLFNGYAPRIAQGERVEKYTWASDGGDGRPKGFMRTDILFPTTTFRPGDAPLLKEVVGYLGPKNYNDMEKADVAAGYTTGFNHIVDLGWFAFIGRPLLWLLQWFHGGVGNWGVAIILLTFLVKLATLYWTTKSMRSMKAMASLAPQLKALQAKYADDRQRLQLEMNALYKENGVNPVAGCLPILLQMPIWIALYRMLSSAGELYQQPFLPGWIDDLTATDPFYVLPAILFVTMFVQARLQPAAADSRQQKILQYGMPIMFGAMAFGFPAGLTLYIFTNTVLSAVHSIYMNKFDKKSQALAGQLKKSQDAQAAPVASAARSNAKNGGPVPAKRVIDAKATEVPPDDSADDSAEEVAPGEAVGTPGSAARNRPRRKKRRR